MSINLHSLLDDIEWDNLSNFLYLLGQDLKFSDVETLVSWAEYQDSSLRDVWNDLYLGDTQKFVTISTHLTGDDTLFCDDCGEPDVKSEMNILANENRICESCRECGEYDTCSRCGDLQSTDDLTWVGDDSRYCEGRCLDSVASWCDECDEYYFDCDADEHRHSGCECEPVKPRFRFLANGKGEIEQNERLHVELPAGTISDEGMYEVYMALVDANLTGQTYDLRKVVFKVDPTWQKKQGNFTRRLSKALYQEMGIKVPAAVMSEVGNIARRHTTDVSSYYVEFTRDLNKDQYAFYNDDSCWWGSHSDSRCALKNWGGIGLRTYNDMTQDSDEPSGRAWVQPLKWDEGMYGGPSLQPTHDAIGADAFAVYNGYGNLEGYIGTRIVAYLTGKTYKKVGVSFGPSYVNGDSGYIVADEETCTKVERVHVSADPHNRFDA